MSGEPLYVGCRVKDRDTLYFLGIVKALGVSDGRKPWALIQWDGHEFPTLIVKRYGDLSPVADSTRAA